MEHLLHIASQYSHIITVEDGSILGGFGQYLSAIIKPNLPHIRTTHLGIPDQFITHGENDILYAQCGYDAKAIEQTILKLQSQL
jgi:1-deoxy-D-xylulose-5-phosphate synthase